MPGQCHADQNHSCASLQAASFLPHPVPVLGLGGQELLSHAKQSRDEDHMHHLADCACGTAFRLACVKSEMLNVSCLLCWLDHILVRYSELAEAISLNLQVMYFLFSSISSIPVRLVCHFWGIPHDYFIQTVFSNLYSHCNHYKSFEVPIVFLGISRLESWFQSKKFIFSLQTGIQPTTVDLGLVNFTRKGVFNSEITTHPQISTEIFVLLYQPSWKMFPFFVDWHFMNQIKISVLLIN